MIYTVTLNPSIDYIVHLDSFKSGITNRTTGEEYYCGGKGILLRRKGNQCFHGARRA